MKTLGSAGGMARAREKGDTRRLAAALIAAAGFHVAAGAAILALRLTEPLPPTPIMVDLQGAELPPLPAPPEPEPEPVQPPPPEAAPEQPEPPAAQPVRAEPAAPALETPRAAAGSPAATAAPAAAPRAAPAAAAAPKPAPAAPKTPAGPAKGTGPKTEGSGEGYVIPQPRQPSADAAPSAPPKSSFREAGGRTGVSASAPQASPLPAAGELPAAAVAPLAPDGAGAVVTRAGGGKGVGVAVPGRGAQGGEQNLDLSSLDKALAVTSSGKGQPSRVAGGSGGGSPGGTVAGSGTGAGVGTAAGSGSSIVWDKPASGRERKLRTAPKPKIPAWVGAQGLTLRASVSFTVSAEGIVSQVVIERSSGYRDVDNALIDAVRNYKFSNSPGAEPIHGRLPSYEINPRTPGSATR